MLKYTVKVIAVGVGICIVGAAPIAISQPFSDEPLERKIDELKRIIAVQSQSIDRQSRSIDRLVDALSSHHPRGPSTQPLPPSSKTSHSRTPLPLLLLLLVPSSVVVSARDLQIATTSTYSVVMREYAIAVRLFPKNTIQYRNGARVIASRDSEPG